ncbi:MAG: hypothetical protein HS116_20425 [Planctomycetes bacterium]|nr:hypothetical protein [Planctomycetota bacterium]
MTPSALSLDLLQRWLPFGMTCWWDVPGRPGRACWGTGYQHWGVQSHQKVLAALAVAAADPGFDAKLAGCSREAVLARALAGLRHTLDQHHSGGKPGPDGNTWGHSWITALGVERMMHGVEALEPHLSDEDRARLRAMLASEAEFQLTHPVVADVWGHSGKNKPESNLWNGALLLRAALMYPDEPHAAAWREKAHEWLLNGISVPADAADETLVAGKPLKEWHRGANFFPHFSLDHHAYLNVGYMVICLSNIAILHYAFKARGVTPPDSLYHHAGDLWALVRRLVFHDGRLIRIGGDSRIRYTYCQDFLLPTLYWAADYFRDPHAWDLLKGQLNLIAHEQKHNEDGSFLSKRLAHLRRNSEVYYTRLESDKASVLSMLRRWAERFPFEPAKPARGLEATVQGGWAEPEHGAVFHRSPTRMASFCWRSSEGPMGLCLPPQDGSLAEWKRNLAGAIRFMGETEQKGDVHAKHIETFPGGFVTSGKMSDKKPKSVAEGWKADEWWIDHRLVFAALPDDRTVLRLEFATLAERRVYIEALEGVKWEVPNDFFNAGRRTYHAAGGARTLEGRLGEPESLDLASPWVNVDDVLGGVGVYGAASWSLLRRGARIGGYCGSILTDALCWPGRWTREAVNGPATLLDTGVVLFSSVSAAATRTFHERNQARRLEAPGMLRAVRITGLDGREYVLAANFGAEPAQATLQAGGGTWLDLVSGKAAGSNGSLAVDLEPTRARLFMADV